MLIAWATFTLTRQYGLSVGLEPVVPVDTLRIVTAASAVKFVAPIPAIEQVPVGLIDRLSATAARVATAFGLVPLSLLLPPPPQPPNATAAPAMLISSMLRHRRVFGPPSSGFVCPNRLHVIETSFCLSV